LNSNDFEIFITRKTKIRERRKKIFKENEKKILDRFMTEEGHFRRDERCIPFMLGKRYCIGQVSFVFVVVVIIGKRYSIGQVQSSVAFAIVVGK
jgi:hypothetical protein